MTALVALVDFHLRIYHTNKSVRRIEADAAGEDPESDDDDNRVTEEEDCGNESCDTQLKSKICVT